MSDPKKAYYGSYSHVYDADDDIPGETGEKKHALWTDGQLIVGEEPTEDHHVVRKVDLEAAQFEAGLWEEDGDTIKPANTATVELHNLDDTALLRTVQDGSTPRVDLFSGVSAGQTPRLRVYGIDSDEVQRYMEIGTADGPVPDDSAPVCNITIPPDASLSINLRDGTPGDGPLSVGPVTAVGNMGVTGNITGSATVQGADLVATDDLNVGNDAAIGGNAAVTGAVTAASVTATGNVQGADLISSDDLVVGDAASISGNIGVGGFASVTGRVMAGDGVSISASSTNTQLSIEDSLGNTFITVEDVPDGGGTGINNRVMYVGQDDDAVGSQNFLSIQGTLDDGGTVHQQFSLTCHTATDHAEFSGIDEYHFYDAGAPSTYGTIVCDGLTEISDESLKDKISPITASKEADRLDALMPVTFEFKHKPGVERRGFVAEPLPPEKQKTLRFFDVKNKVWREAPKPATIRPTEILADAVASMKGLKARVVELEQLVKDLAKEIDKLKEPK